MLALSSWKVSDHVTLRYLSSPVLLDVLVVGVIRVLSPLGFDGAHQDGHNNECKHANHHRQIPDDVAEVLLSQSLVQSVGCSCHVAPPVVQVMTQSTGQGLLQVKGQVRPIRCTNLVGGKTKEDFLLFPQNLRLILLVYKVNLVSKFYQYNYRT